MGSMQEYDIVVIGSGPGGQKAAIASAKLGKSVAIVERGQMLGGVCVNTGTIPSKTLREAVLYLTGMSQRELYGASYRVKEKITPADLLARTQHVISKEVDVVRNQLMRNRIDLLIGQKLDALGVSRVGGGFSNGSSIRFLVAGTKKKSIAWAEGSGYALAHATELGSYYGQEGLATFEESFAKSNPDRLFIYESTAKGVNNVMHDRWEKALGDPLTWRANFIGWWANPHNAFGRGTPHFEAHGRRPRTREERDMIEQVAKIYDWEVTPEQLCWYRWAYANAKEALAPAA